MLHEIDRHTRYAFIQRYSRIELSSSGEKGASPACKTHTKFAVQTWRERVENDSLKITQSNPLLTDVIMIDVPV